MTQYSSRCPIQNAPNIGLNPCANCLSNLVEGIFGKPPARLLAWSAISSWLKALSCASRQPPKRETQEKLFLLDSSNKDQ